MLEICVILLGVAVVILGISCGVIAKTVDELHEKQKNQDSINKMVIKHLNQLLVDVDALIDDSENSTKN